jgi:hypothetical protein
MHRNEGSEGWGGGRHLRGKDLKKKFSKRKNGEEKKNLKEEVER